VPSRSNACARRSGEPGRCRGRVNSSSHASRPIAHEFKTPLTSIKPLHLAVVGIAALRRNSGNWRSSLMKKQTHESAGHEACACRRSTRQGSAGARTADVAQVLAACSNILNCEPGTRMALLEASLPLVSATGAAFARAAATDRQCAEIFAARIAHRCNGDLEGTRRDPRSRSRSGIPEPERERIFDSFTAAAG